MPDWRYSKGLHELGNGLYAYLQPDGGWGWSNAGLIADSGQSLLVDTLFDLNLTREMLTAMRGATKAADKIGTLVNTHANGDHCWGNELVPGAEIVASRTGAAEMAEVPPQLLATMVQQAPNLGPLGQYISAIFGAFDFNGITLTPPTRTFDGELDLKVGDKAVKLIEVGPAHTKGDVLVHVPAERTVFTGDILFIDGTPIMWEGPVSNWIRACDRILAMDVQTVVPGHGPITDKNGVRRVKEYLEYVTAEARRRFDAGMPAFEAAKDIALGDYSAWGDAERIAVNVDTLYREFRHDHSERNVMMLFGQMAQLAKP